jgi:glycerol-3-phosphate acyltransferase PlsY
MINLILLYTVPVLVAYILGSIPTAVWVGKRFYNIDVRNEGSGNAGATNTIRVLGLKAGIPVLIIDVLKGFAAVSLAPIIAVLFSDEPLSAYLVLASAAAVVLGHTFPLFAGFKGGKGVATLLGVGIGLFPAAAGTVVLIFAIILILTHYVSLSSVIASVSFPFLVIFVFHSPNVIYSGLAIGVAIFIPITHRKNIVRLFNGTESKIRFRKKN